MSYAITIHKSQGSDFPAVVVGLAAQPYLLLQRNLVDTRQQRPTIRSMQASQEQCSLTAFRALLKKTIFRPWTTRTALLLTFIGSIALSGGGCTTTPSRGPENADHDLMRQETQVQTPEQRARQLEDTRVLYGDVRQSLEGPRLGHSTNKVAEALRDIYEQVQKERVVSREAFSALLEAILESYGASNESVRAQLDQNRQFTDKYNNMTVKEWMQALKKADKKNDTRSILSAVHYLRQMGGEAEEALPLLGKIAQKEKRRNVPDFYAKSVQQTIKQAIEIIERDSKKNREGPEAANKPSLKPIHRSSAAPTEPQPRQK